MNKFKFLIAIVVLVCVGWTGAWLFAAGKIGIEVDNLSSASKATQVSCADRSITGFPFRFDVECKGATILNGDDQVTIKNVKATVRVYRPTHLLAFVDGPIQLSNDFTGSERELNFSSLQMSARLTWELSVQRISALGKDFTWTDSLLGQIELANAKEIEAHLIAPEDAETGLLAFAKVSSANLLELQTQNADFTLELDATHVSRNVASWAYPSTVHQWQSNGGKLLVQSLDFKADDMRFSATGNVELDQQGRLNGAITTQSKGLVELFNPEAYGILAPTIFGLANAEGEYKSIWRANSGNVSIGVAPLFSVPPLY